MGFLNYHPHPHPQVAESPLVLQAGESPVLSMAFCWVLWLPLWTSQRCTAPMFSRWRCRFFFLRDFSWRPGMPIFFRWRLFCWRNGENVRNGLEFFLKTTCFLLTGVGARGGGKVQFCRMVLQKLWVVICVQLKWLPCRFLSAVN